MVYWGCSTPRNRCAWGLFALAAAAGGLLLIAGGAKLDVCASLPVRVHAAGACAVGPVAMMVIGGFGVPASGITVVRRTPGGPQVYQYDAAGKLVAAPDCARAGRRADYVLDGHGPKAPPALHLAPGGKGGPGGDKQHAPGLPGSPRGGGVPRLYGSDSGEPAATGEVIVRLGPLTAGRPAAAQLFVAAQPPPGQAQAQAQQQQRGQQPPPPAEGK
ncbi:hypothetical protein HT031_006363 [Scenedesmus sp. PABB004]|nr:hypothetical protein HT031_006363 [Scenedesmus sp. PABB004]